MIASENDSVKYTYSYDSRGNIISKKEYDISLDESGNKVYTEIENDSYTYDATWKDKLTSYNGQTITYDVSGNPTNYLGHNLSWTMGRQLASFDGIAYTYNEDGIRTSKTSNGVTTKFYLNGTDIIEQTDGTNTLHFYYDSSNELIGFNCADNAYFYVKNQQGDITDITNSNGEVVASYTYDPWGKVVAVTGDVVIGELNPFRYRSYYYDTEIEMYYLQSRYYDADVCRFINCDDVNYIGLTESEVSYNPFAYCENNPVNDSDPSGTLSFVVRRWMIAMPIDMALMAFGLGGLFAPIKTLGKTFGLKVMKTRVFPDTLRFLNKFKSILLPVCNKIVNIIKGVKIIKGFKFIKNLSGSKIAASIMGFSLIKTPSYKLLNLLFVNSDIFLSLGGFVSGILDLVLDGYVNNSIWRFGLCCTS